MTAAPVHLAGETLLLDPEGALWWPARRLLAVADLHLEKASHFAARGQLLPPFDSAITLDRLARVVRRHRPAIIVALGDSFHDAAGSLRLAAGDLARIGHIAHDTDLIWLVGNHDPTPPATLPGRTLSELCLGTLSFRHLPTADARGEIAGHLHPKATVKARGASLTRRCFVADARRILMPAFGAFAGGLDLGDPAIAGLFPRHARAFLLGRDRLFSFALRRGKAPFEH